jgi:hypothetical protein
MAALTAPLCLSEVLDAMLLGWLERRADRRTPDSPALRATAVLTIADDAMPEIERLCAGWAMSVRRPARGLVAVIEGPARAVEGFVAVSRLP